ncbi:MAG: hypothetical protein ACLP4W_30150 [Mycobacterium sp.]|uniref:hypothetical protein n=1 Tax=Mycobacterium sp. TaxID=1785 RepID=UPI003F9ACD9A
MADYFAALSRSMYLAMRERARQWFSGHSGLGLFNCSEHAFTEVQASPLFHAPEGKPDLAHLNGELAYLITELFHDNTFMAQTERYEPRTPPSAGL